MVPPVWAASPPAPPPMPALPSAPVAVTLPPWMVMLPAVPPAPVYLESSPRGALFPPMPAPSPFFLAVAVRLPISLSSVLCAYTVKLLPSPTSMPPFTVRAALFAKIRCTSPVTFTRFSMVTVPFATYHVSPPAVPHMVSPCCTGAAFSCVYIWPSSPRYCALSANAAGIHTSAANATSVAHTAFLPHTVLIRHTPPSPQAHAASTLLRLWPKKAQGAFSAVCPPRNAPRA